MSMDQSLQESKTRGSFLFPFERYHTEDDVGSFYVSCHWHPDVEILYLRRGKIQISLNGETFLPEAGTIVFINREVIHQLHSLEAGVLYDAVVFPLEFLSFDLMDYCQQKYLLPLIQKKLVFPTFLRPDDPGYDRVREQLDLLTRLHQTFPEGYQFATKAALFQILSILIEHNALIPTSRLSLPGEKRLETMRAMISYLADHHAEPLALEDVAAHFYMAPTYLCRYFRKNFGCSFTRYVNTIRLEEACRLLSETSLPVMEISLRCGFGNLSYFTRLFKEKRGVTPSAYRKASLLSGSDTTAVSVSEVSASPTASAAPTPPESAPDMAQV